MLSMKSQEIEEIIPAEDGQIEVEVAITIDATDADKKDNADDVLINLANDLDLEAIIEEYFLTAAPTRLPSAVPTISIPSATPTLTGTVLVISLSSSVDEELTQSEIASSNESEVMTYSTSPFSLMESSI